MTRKKLQRGNHHSGDVWAELLHRATGQHAEKEFERIS
jgi:hypothetical protein